MADGDSDQVTGHSRTGESRTVVRRRSRRRRRRWYQKLPPWVRGYWVEIGLVAAALLAIFLLVEQWDIRLTLLAWARRALSVTSGALGSMGRALLNWVRALTPSDATAIVMLLGVVVIAGWRIRWRLLRSERLWSTHCPRCDSLKLHRVRRRPSDRVLGQLGFPVRRYLCGECGWSGLRLFEQQAVESSSPGSLPPRGPAEKP